MRVMCDVCDMMCRRIAVCRVPRSVLPFLFGAEAWVLPGSSLKRLMNGHRPSISSDDRL